MAVTQEFINAVTQNDLLLVRIMMKDSLLLDPTCKQFNEMEQYAKSNIDGLYQAHDDEMLEYDHAKWNIEYLNEQLVKLMSNFSEERAALLKNMVGVLYKDKAENIVKND